MNGLLALKKAEFGLELRYNIEFNRLLNSAYGRPWTEADLQEFDRIMSRIPDDLLRGNPKFEAFLRGAKHPKLAGQSSSSTGQVTLYGSLDDLLATGWIAEIDDPRQRPADESDRRRIFRLTTVGRRTLAAETDRLSQLVRVARTRIARTRSAS